MSIAVRSKVGWSRPVDIETGLTTLNDGTEIRLSYMESCDCEFCKHQRQRKEKTDG